MHALISALEYLLILFYVCLSISLSVSFLSPRTRNPSRKAMVALGVSSLFFMLPWQFAQFVLLTQVRDGLRKRIKRGCFKRRMSF